MKKYLRFLSICIPVLLWIWASAWAIETFIHDQSEGTYCGVVLSKDRSYRSTYFELGMQWDVGVINTFSVGSITYNRSNVGDRLCFITMWHEIFPEGQNGFRIFSVFIIFYINASVLFCLTILLFYYIYKKLWDA